MRALLLISPAWTSRWCGVRADEAGGTLLSSIRANSKYMIAEAGGAVKRQRVHPEIGDLGDWEMDQFRREPWRSAQPAA
jgi:hypothetical protein